MKKASFSITSAILLFSITALAEGGKTNPGSVVFGKFIDDRPTALQTEFSHHDLSYSISISDGKTRTRISCPKLGGYLFIQEDVPGFVEPKMPQPPTITFTRKAATHPKNEVALNRLRRELNFVAGQIYPVLTFGGQSHDAATHLTDGKSAGTVINELAWECGSSNAPSTGLSGGTAGGGQVGAIFNSDSSSGHSGGGTFNSSDGNGRSGEFSPPICGGLKDCEMKVLPEPSHSYGDQQDKTDAPDPVLRPGEKTPLFSSQSNPAD